MNKNDADKAIRLAQVVEARMKQRVAELTANAVAEDVAEAREHQRQVRKLELAKATDERATAQLQRLTAERVADLVNEANKATELPAFDLFGKKEPAGKG